MSDETERAEMHDVSHTPPHGEGANEVWERGEEDAPTDEEVSTATETGAVDRDAPVAGAEGAADE